MAYPTNTPARKCQSAQVGLLFLITTLFLLTCTPQVFAQDSDDGNPTGLNIIRSIEDATQPENISTTLTVFLLLTVLTLAPAILVATTSFTRIVVVFGFLRQAMSTQQSPPNQVLIMLALVLTAHIMMPTYTEINEQTVQPYIRGEFENPQDAMTSAMQPIRSFMLGQLEKSPKDLALFIDIAHLEHPKTRDDVPTHVIVPAFILGELRHAFTIGFVILIPFLIIDMVVASTLMAMGMMMLPPVFVSLPFKIVLFVLVDGWYLLIGSLTRSFG